jgi:hypothetical protein
MHIRGAFWVLFALLAFSECTKSADMIEIETPSGPILTDRSTMDPASPQQITPLSVDQLESIRALADRGPAFVAAYLSLVQEPDLEDYDRAFQEWQRSEAPLHSAAEVIDILGAYFGEICNQDLNMEWVTVTDNSGTDYAIRGVVVEVMAYPFSSVAKRVDSGESEFLYGIYYAIKDMVESGEYVER